MGARPTSFFFADDMVAALREAARVARPGAPVVMQLFGDPERCDLEAVKHEVSRFRPSEQAHSYWRPGIGEALAEEAGLRVEHACDLTWPYVYADEDAFADAMLAAGGAALVAGPEREDELSAAIRAALAHRRGPDGAYSVWNEWHLIIGRAPLAQPDVE